MTDSTATRPTFVCCICLETFRFYGEGEPATAQTCFRCNPWVGNPANLTDAQNAKRAEMRVVMVQHIGGEQEIETAWADQTADFDAHMQRLCADTDPIEPDYPGMWK